MAAPDDPQTRGRAHREAYSRDERRRILLEHRYILTADQLCAKWRITRYRLRKWKGEFNYPYFIGDAREMTVAALQGGAATIPELIEHLDYLNHARYSEAEVTAILEGLRSDGMALQEDGRWRYDSSHSLNGASFIF